MGKYSLEEYLKGRIRGHREPIDTNDLWESLNLEPKRKKKPWWILGVVVLLIGTCVGIQQFPVKNGTFTYSNHNIEQNQANEQTSTIDDTNLSAINDKETQSLNNKSAKKSQLTTESNNTTSSIGKTQTTKAQINKASTAASQSTATTKPLASNQLKSNNQSNTTNFKQIIASKAKPNQTEYSAAASTINTRLTEELSMQATDVNNAIDPMNISLLGGILELLNIDRRKLKLKKAQEVKSNIRKHSPWSIELLSGLYYVDRDLILDNENFANHLAIRNMTETSLESNMIGIHGRCQLHKNVYVKLGIEQQKINERFNLQITNDSTFIKEEEPIVLLVEETGDTAVLEVGAAEILQSKTEVWEHYNNHSYVNIPVTLGFQASFSSWKIFAEAVPMVSLYRGFTGKMIALERYEVVEDPDYFKKHMAVGLRLNLGLSYQLEDLTFSITPSVQRYSGMEYGIFQNYQMAGLNAAVRYQF